MADPSRAATGSLRDRLEGIDILRGWVMVLMALDHVRDYFGDFSLDPTVLETTTPALFFTRWVTHFCAPVFVFLAGTSAFLYGAKRTKGELARFLATRGLWLIVLEFTVIHAAWMFSFTASIYFVQVIAAIGAAMIALSVLVFLPVWGVGLVGLAIAAGHNLLDPVQPEDFGGWMWQLVHESGFVPLGQSGGLLLVIYPLLPWVGVMALGYAFGRWMQLERPARRRCTLVTGLVLCALFLAVRWNNLYGNPTPWVPGQEGVMQLVTFLNCRKYPPSLAYLAMTLGPALVLLAAVDRPASTTGRALMVFGRVPLFYYVVHMALINGAACAFYWIAHGVPFSAIRDGLELLFSGQGLPPWYGYPLWVVYVAWAIVVAVLFPLCRWYGGVKARGASKVWSYL